MRPPVSRNDNEPKNKNHRGEAMKRVVGLGAGLFLLGGCALPVPVQIAHWALDGFSYLATEKSIADHGISIAANKDCAVLRVVLDDGIICRDFDVNGVAVADSGGATDAIDVAAIADFETAAGGKRLAADGRRTSMRPLARDEAAATARIHKPLMFEDGVQLSGYPLVIETDKAGALVAAARAKLGALEVARTAGKDVAGLAEFDTAAGGDIEAAVAAIKGEPKTAAAESQPEWQATATRVALAAKAAADKEPVAGLYFVIGSFRDHENALKLRKQFRVLTPAVLAANLDQGTVYRVVVGPFDQRDAKTVHQQIYRAGIVDSWAIRVNPGEWSMAMVDPPAEAPVLAELHPESLGMEILGYLKKLTRWIY
jgi:cell division septation protein DedD